MNLKSFGNQMCFGFMALFGIAVPLAAQDGLTAPESQFAEPGRAFAFRAGSPGNQSFLGVGVAEIDSGRARDLKLKDEHGVEITRVEENSAAAKAGVQVGDVVLEYNGQRVEGTEQFMRLVRETPAGREVKLLMSRNGAPQAIVVAMGHRKGNILMSRNGEWFDMPDIQIPDIPRVYTTWSSSMLGIEAESLSKQLAEYFGVNEGVLVRSVIKGSAAEKAGIKAGDVITKMDQTRVATPGEITGAIRSARTRKPFPMTIVRDRREATVTVTLEDDRSESAPRVKPRARSVKL